MKMGMRAVALPWENVTICAAIPHHDLCIQWDVCHEMLIWDGQPLDMFPKVGTSHDEILRRMQRICASVPEDVELGVHLCYGDFRAKHFLEPRARSGQVDHRCTGRDIERAGVVVNAGLLGGMSMAKFLIGQAVRRVGNDRCTAYRGECRARRAARPRRRAS